MVMTASRKPTRRASSEPARYLTQGDIAHVLGLSLSKVGEMSLTGEIPGRVTFGRSVRHERTAVEAWLAQQAGGNDGRAA